MSEQTPDTEAHIVFFGMHIELYQWIFFFAGAQTVRLAWEAWMSFRAKLPTYLSNLMIPMLYLGYTISLLLVAVSCSALYMIKKKCTKGVVIAAYLSYALTAVSFADSLTTVIATAISREDRIKNCIELYHDTPPCQGCNIDQFCAESVTASLMWQSFGIALNLAINIFLSVGVHQYCIHMKKVGESNKEEKPTVDFKVEPDAEGFQVVELK
ncbi:hypothetical protein BGW37DRAFT_554980 [Umbelopsis sp. PMI_123]|nr:hypothetical protein BGW37DRAFT_554980 [Umbelopsis sp. PMI_123]